MPDDDIFPADDVRASRLDLDLQANNPLPDGIDQTGPPCHACKRASAELAWFYFESPRWTWEALCGRAGYLSYCDHCERQVSFQLTVLN